MRVELQGFINYLNNEKQSSENTIVSYERDLKKLSKYLEEHNVHEVGQITTTNLNSFILELEKEGRKASTVSRTIASMKAFFHFCEKNKLIEENPAEILKAPKIEKKEPSTMSFEETSILLEQPSGNTPKELRDKAMLELLYATGIRVSELISLKVCDINQQMEYVVCGEQQKEKSVRYNASAKKALEKYLKYGRPALISDENCPWLFTNCSGKSMSRQGFWKLIKYYGRKAGIKSEITPLALRHSLAMSK